MTGTDLYRDLPGDPEALQSIALADRIVVLQARALAALPAGAAAKARVIVQSAPALPRRRPPAGAGDPVRFIAVGHLRDVKDPLTLARAAVRLASVPGIAVEHIGAALDPALAAELERLTRGCQKSRQQLILADPDGVGDPVATGKQIGDDGNFVSVGLRKQYGTVALKTFGDRGEFVGEADAFAGNCEPATFGKMGEPCPQIGWRVGRFPRSTPARRARCAGSRRR